jgi:hypothetical protein
MTSQGAMLAGDSGLSSLGGKFKTIQYMANIKCECAAVLCRLLEAAQANEDPSPFQNSGAGQRFGSPDGNGNSPLSLTSMSKSGGFTCCVPVLPTIKEIQNYTLPYIKEL